MQDAVAARWPWAPPPPPPPPLAPLPPPPHIFISSTFSSLALSALVAVQILVRDRMPSRL